MLRLILVSIAIIAISRVSMTTSAPQSDNASNENNRQLIVCNINFDRNVNLEASWSSRATEVGPFPKIFVLDYKEYADTFEEFMKNYPFFTLNPHGEARSDSTFGDVAKNKFFEHPYSTTYFNIDDNGCYYDYVNVTSSKFLSYSVSVNIKIGFLKKDTNLFLLPYMTGKIVSHGHVKRNLAIGLHIDTLTFWPKHMENQLSMLTFGRH